MNRIITALAMLAIVVSVACASNAPWICTPSGAGHGSTCRAK